MAKQEITVVMINKHMTFMIEKGCYIIIVYDNGIV